MDRFGQLQRRLETFYMERDWQQFQTPKDLAGRDVSLALNMTV